MILILILLLGILNKVLSQSVLSRVIVQLEQKLKSLLLAAFNVEDVNHLMIAKIQIAAKTAVLAMIIMIMKMSQIPVLIALVQRMSVAIRSSFRMIPAA